MHGEAQAGGAGALAQGAPQEEGGAALGGREDDHGVSWRLLLRDGDVCADRRHHHCCDEPTVREVRGVKGRGSVKDIGVHQIAFSHDGRFIVGEKGEREG